MVVRLLVMSLLLPISFLAASGCGTSETDEPYEPAALFLTWQTDPTTTMTIDWHVTEADAEARTTIYYRLRGEQPWRLQSAGLYDFPHSERQIHRADIRGLEPGSTYEFRFGEDSRTYKFRTMPAVLERPLVFAAGGDTWYEDDFQRMNRVVMGYDPDFIVWGGDLAYAHGDPAFLYKWIGWFDGIRETLIDDNGRVVPIVLAIGNHETFSESQFRSARRHNREPFSDEETREYLERYNLWDNKVTFFFDLFAFPGNPPYGVLDFSDYLSLVILDTDHHTPVAGPQADWLREVLRERMERPHLFPVYHVPAWPSHRSFDGRVSREVRDHWVPLFEEFGIRVAFENHDHTYKRTHPIRNGAVDESGIIYVGDGAWVAGPRDGDNRDAWYIDRFFSENHAIIVTLEKNRQNYRVVSINGMEIDSFHVPLSAVPAVN